MVQTEQTVCVDMITGYSSINQTLFERNCIETPDYPGCPGIIESVEHMMFHCPLYNEVRHYNISERRTENTWTGFLEDEKSFKSFRFYVTEVFRCRKEYILTVNSSNSPPPCG